VVSWEWWSPGSGGLPGVVVSQEWWSPRSGGLLGAKESQEKMVPRRKILGEKGSWDKNPGTKWFLGENSS
jgi:hypothetical protein